jgi:hypothetical protein
MRRGPCRRRADARTQRADWGDLGDGVSGETVDDGGVNRLLDLASMIASDHERRDASSTSLLPFPLRPSPLLAEVE